MQTTLNRGVTYSHSLSYEIVDIMENHTSASNESRCIVAMSQQVSKVKRRNKKRWPRWNLIRFLFLWCFCILSLRNFQSQLIHIRNYDSNEQGVVRTLLTQSTPRATNHVVSVVGRNAKSIRQDVVEKLSTTPSSIEKSVASSSNGRSYANTEGALCIRSNRWYGRTFNRILELSNALAIIADDVNNNTKKQTFVGLAPNLSEWYETFLDQRKDIRLNYTGSCVSVWTSKDLFFVKEYKNSKKSRQQLQHLIPKKSFRDEAEQALVKYSNSGKQKVVTVHRRHLEGVCVKKAKGALVACVKDRVLVKRSMSTNALLDTCNYDYTMIHDKHKADLEHNKSVVVLCTDQQVPQLDSTFPIRSNYSFPVEAWMMAKSDVHYGNPHSTVDLVVAVWRTGQNLRTHPEQCYEED